MNSKDKIIGKVLLKGTVSNISPIIVGQGRGDLIDIEIIKDKNGVPYIPATSFLGALRHFIKNNFEINSSDIFDYFFGTDDTSKEKTYQSHFILYDLTPKNEELAKSKINIRDGIKINNKIGITEDKAKYNYEILEPKVDFYFNAEFVLREVFADSKEEFYKIIQTILHILKNKEIKVGAITTRGFGEVNLNQIDIYDFDFRKEEDGIKYLTEKYQNPKNKISENLLERKNKTFFHLLIELKIKNSLMIGSYSPNPEAPDKSHIESNGEAILTGTSIKGALRNQAIKIVNTFGKNGENFVKELMGFSDEITKEKRKSKMIVKETTIEDYLKKLQNRIKVDRFTGGVIESALFDSFAVWAKENNKVIIDIKVENVKEEEIGLLLLLLKDLWTGRIAIGGEKNIGRGVLEGISADIIINRNKKIKARIENKDDGINIIGNNNNIKQDLEYYVSKFIEVIRG